MKNPRLWIAASAVLVTSAAVVGVILTTQPTAPRQLTGRDATSIRLPPPQVQPTAPAEVELPPLAPEAPPLPAEVISNVSSGPSTNAPPTGAPASQTEVPKKQKPELQDPLARVALSLVGADPEAEAYWLGAIYDSSLPNEEREDLMEDLNEDGLSDPKRPVQQDLPLILNRLAIIEEVAPWADDFMVPHLQEAYKDLLNLAEITQGGGEAVR